MVFKKTYIILFATLLLLSFGIAFALHQSSHQAMHPMQMRALGGYMYHPARPVEAVNLVDNKLEIFNPQRLKGIWSLLFFGYTYCPDICPTTMQTLRKVEQHLIGTELEGKLQIALVTVDPDRDTAENMDQYVNYFNPDFLGLSGKLSDILDFATQLSVRFEKQPLDDAGNYLVDHSSQIAIINPNGQYHGFLKPPFKIENMAEVLLEMQHQI